MAVKLGTRRDILIKKSLAMQAPKLFKEVTRSVLQIAPVLPEDTRQQAIALSEANMLNQLVTSWVPINQHADTIGTLPGLRKIFRRRPVSIGAKLVKRVPLADLIEQFIRFYGGSDVDAVDKRFAIVDKAAKRIIKPSVQIIFGREDGCLSSFRFGKKRGVHCLYDLPIAHYKTINSLMEREAACFPGIDTYSNEYRRFSKDRAFRKDEELSLADSILCPSDFVRTSLLDAGISHDKIHVLPFAAEPEWLSVKLPPTRKPIFLHVGQISQRKGVHRLLIAWKRLKAYRTHRLRLVGHMRLSPSFLRDYTGMFEHILPVPRNQLLAHYMQARAFVLNALGEGFSIAILEAMSSGTAVLLSRNSGGEGFIDDGREGRLFDFGDEEQLAEVLDWALSHPKELEEMGLRAREKAATWTWPHYRRAFLEWISTFSQR